MATVDSVREEMRATGNFDEAVLSALTQEDVDHSIKNAKPFSPGTWSGEVKPFLTTYTGNNFRIVNGIWYWDDQPGNQCGRGRTWNWTPRPGASYRNAGNCPQGYPWYQLEIPTV